MNEFKVVPIKADHESFKLKKGFCQSCGKWMKHPENIKEGEDSVSELLEIWLEEGAIPVMHICNNCRIQLIEVLEKAE